MPVVETNALNKQYDLGQHYVDALLAVDFIVQEGEFVAIMGPSGSGKSTLLHLIGGLDQPTNGEVILNGQRLSLMKDKQITLLRRRNIGFVFQFFNLLPTLTAAENITLPLLIDGKNLQDYQERRDEGFWWRYGCQLPACKLVVGIQNCKKCEFGIMVGAMIPTDAKAVEEQSGRWDIIGRIVGGL